MEIKVQGRIQAMYLNGPLGGRIIELPNPAPEKITAAVNLNRCMHGDPAQPFPITMLTYNVNKPANPMLPYTITLEGDFDDTGWYCPQCKAEAEVKYKLDKIKNILKDEEEEEW